LKYIFKYNLCSSLMILKILGTLDILTAIVFYIFGIFHILPPTLVIILAVYLLGKSIFYLISHDFASLVDILAGIIMLLSVTIFLPKFIVILVSLYLLQKGIFSWF
jgi:hypothetical protein